ncbi:MAG TPA: glycosyltransferase family 4 protein [Allosphingosinicella sp.]|nr:glycosyltransferase family 4 protein [Allosphingosinicella sp.]
MKILMTADAVGGVWQYSTDLARGLSRLGVETVLAVSGPSPTAAQAEAASAVEGVTLLDTGLPLDWLADDSASVERAGKAVAKLAQRHRADIVQLNAPALAASVSFDQPVVAVAHSCVATWWAAVKRERLCEEFRWRADLTARGLEAADVVVAPTDAFAKATEEAYRLKRRLVTVHNGRAPLALPERAQHDCGFTAGRLWDKGKNVATLDRAAARLPFPLYAAGPTRGPNGDSVGLEHVHGLGSLGDKDMGRWLAARPVFVSAAVYEPFGLAVLEAAQAGCALVLSDIPTFRELWHGVAAFVDPMDSEAFAKTIGLVVGDEFARAQMGRAAQERASQFTVEAMAAKMARIYDSLAARPEPVRPRNMVAA